MRGIGSTMWKVAGACSLTAVVIIGSVGSAAAGQASNVGGAVVCDSITGNQVVTWTFTNNTIGLADIQTATANPTLLTAGSITATSVAMSPSTGIASLGTSVGQTIASSDAVGTLSILVTWFNFTIDTSQTAGASVTLAGGCVAAPTTTAVGAGAGSLPHVGRNTTTVPLVAASLIGVGLALVAIRRRPSVG